MDPYDVEDWSGMFQEAYPAEEEEYAGDVGNVQTGWGKGAPCGGKGKGYSYWSGKGQSGKGKGGKKGGVKGTQKGTGKGKGKTQFYGQCYHCWDWGHSQNDCPHEVVTHDAPQKGKGWGKAPNVCNTWRKRHSPRRRD